MNCSFCHPDQPLTYALHSLPTTILLPHLFHLAVLGLATSGTLTNRAISSFRLKSLFISLALLALDIYTSTLAEMPTPPASVPTSLFATSSLVRPLVFVAFDLALAFLVYITSTGRFVFFPFLAAASTGDDADPDELLAQTGKLINESNLALQMAQMKLRGLNVARNAVVRDEGLRRADGRYWEVVRRVEGEGSVGVGVEGEGVGSGMDESVFEDEEVQAAMARAFGSGNVDVQKMRKEAQGFVDNITKGLD